MKTLNWLLSNRGKVEKVITQGLQNCINAHGPITKEWKASASKRIISELKALIFEK